MFDMYFALKRGMNKDNSLNVRLGINRLDKNIIKYICDIYFQNQLNDVYNANEIFKTAELSDKFLRENSQIMF